MKRTANSASTRLLKRGDIIVCVTKELNSFTYGKKYEVLMDQFGPDRMSIVDVMNDRGDRYMPASNYFATLEEWRQMRIDELTKPVD
jgi:hypothetical protein